MYAQVAKSKESQSGAVANSVTQKKRNGKHGFRFVDNRSEAVAQGKLKDLTCEKNIKPDQLRDHENGCSCSQCSSNSDTIQRVEANDHILASDGKISINLEKSVRDTKGTEVVQLTDADLSINGAIRGHGHAGLGDGPGGIDHAEQRAWNAALGNINTAFASIGIVAVNVNYNVTQTICPACQDWFEQTAYVHLQQQSVANNNKAFTLIVTVNGVNVNVLGQNETRWPNTVGDEERWPLVDQLKDMLVTWGGLGENAIFTIRGNGTLEKHETWDLEQTIRDMEQEIRESNDRYVQFQENGMWLEGNRADIHLGALEQEKNDAYEAEHRAAH
ncbi:MAG: hypothetical protein JW915_21170 [Chitinispirillaceae bacterium]|nr:hypothetical protein [Chitinispirillaceae bacterium]